MSTDASRLIERSRRDALDYMDIARKEAKNRDWVEVDRCLSLALDRLRFAYAVEAEARR